MNSLTSVIAWYEALQPRERLMVIATGIVVIATLFYLLAWEPVYKGLEEESQQLAVQSEIRDWMQQASNEARSLRAAGVSANRRNANMPVSLSVEQTIATAGLKNNLSKIESAGKDSARVVLEAVSFNQMIVWLNTLEQAYGITAASANIDRQEKPGLVDARLNLSRE